MDFKTLTGEDLAKALALDVKASSDAALAAALVPREEAVAALFAIADADATPAQADTAEAITASIGEIETEQNSRTAVKAAATAKFAAAKAAKDARVKAAAEGDDEGTEGDESEEGTEAEETDEGTEGDESEETDEGTEGDESGEGDGDGAGEGDGEGDGVTTASAKDAAKGAAKKVARATRRPAKDDTPPITLTAAADVPGFATGSKMDGMDALAKAFIARAKGFAPWNEQAAQRAFSANGEQPLISKVGLAFQSMGFSEAMTASGSKGEQYTPGQEFRTLQAAVKDHQKALAALIAGGQGITADALTAAGWCAPSPVAYNYVADYVVDGLVTVPEVGAPRGGLFFTTGPVRSSQGAALDDFGWTQTEQQAIDRTPKNFETIDCPEFEDHRLDAVGYGYTIPFLTQKAYPELVTDTLRFAQVLWAHRMNRRTITDMVALSTPVSFNGYGSSFTDSLEALALIAVAERRRWNVGVNAIMEVKAPIVAQEIYRADISRRNGIAKDSVSDGDIARHFADRKLAVEYVADWQEVSVTGGVMALPGTFKVMMYPSGTFAKAMEDVVNISATYDAASLLVNEYTGIFFEQAYLTLQVAYGSSLVAVPVNTAGEQGQLSLSGIGDHKGNGSF